MQKERQGTSIAAGRRPRLDGEARITARPPVDDTVPEGPGRLLWMGLDSTFEDDDAEGDDESYLRRHMAIP